MNVTAGAIHAIDTLFDRAIKETAQGALVSDPIVVSTKHDHTSRFLRRGRTSHFHTAKGAPAQGSAMSSYHSAQVQEKDNHLITLSMVSCDFRLISMFEFPDAENVKEFFANSSMGRQASSPGSSEGKHAHFVDHLCEFVNLTCGSVTRGIRNEHPYMGMSTPFALSAKCKHHAGMVNPIHVKSMDFSIDQLQFNLTYALCVADGFELDLTLPAEHVQETSGELELF